MCQPVKCATCQKTTWAGCGQHVEQVMANVAPTDRCECPREKMSQRLLNAFRGR